MKTKIIDRWKPIRSGRFYCSPACGGGKFCTWAEYQEVTKKAAALAAKLSERGGRWEPRVHENLGWHYCAVLTTSARGLHDQPLMFKMYESSGYSCMFGEGEASGDCAWHDSQHYSTPFRALAATLLQIRRYVARRNKELAALEAALKGEPLTDEPCPSTIRLMTSANPEIVECQGRKGHTGSHWHLNLNWKDEK